MEKLREFLLVIRCHRRLDNICGKCLKNDCSYRRHMVCVHGIKFTCELCGKDYSAMIGLKVHQRNVHGINS